MSKLHDALEDCLRGLHAGESLDAVLASRPETAAELRPLLQAAIQAREAGHVEVAAEVTRRGRVRLLEQAIKLRHRKPAAGVRVIDAWPRVAITLGLLAVLLLTSTGLVSASSGALPGDQLYQVKRTWEDVQLFFVHPEIERDLLQSRFEQERLDEIGELLGQRRAAPISFSGLVMQQQDGRWLVSGIHVEISRSTDMPAGPISEGEPVIITGLTRSDSTVAAQEVQILQPGSALPPLELSGPEKESHSGEVGAASSGLQPAVATQVRASYQFSGIVESMEAGAWRINGQPVDADQATVIGAVKVGSAVDFEGYYSADGRFVVTKVVVRLTPAQQRNNPREDAARSSGDYGGGERENGGGGGD